MQLKIYKCLPYLLSYSDNLPADVGGRATMFFVRIRPKYKDDEGIAVHECTHIKFYWMFTIPLLILAGVGGFFNEIVWAGLFFAPSFEAIFYQFFRPYRKWAEVKAYKEQLKYVPASDNPEAFISMYYAPALANKYGLNITEEEAKELLS